MYTLVLNCGSSSLKYQLFEVETERVLAKGLCERIGIEGSNLTHKTEDGKKIKLEAAMPTHNEAVTLVIDTLTNEEHGVIKDVSEIAAVGHRVLHGGAKFSESVLIDEKVIEAIEECIVLGPLHNPANLMGIRACEKIMPNVPQVAVFDTAFHQTMPAEAFMYAIPYKYYEEHDIRRYGFHGTSHRYIAKRVPEFLGVSEKGLKMVVCHLGNGSSLCAVKDGKSVDTTMGLTPLEGVLMGTRSGDVDPQIVERIATLEGVTADKAVTILNKESGLLGMTGISSDCRDVQTAAREGDKRAIVAMDALCYRIAKYIGAYAAAMKGIDVIAFTAGIGENDAEIRETVCSYLGFMGVEIDAEANKVRGIERDFTGPNAKIKTIVIPTNEELMIARDTIELALNK